MSGSYALTTAVAPRPMPWPLQPGHEPQWFAVRTRFRFEKKVAAQLKCKGYEVYLPLLTEHHTWSDRQREITIPLFPSYSFVQIDHSPAAWRNVLQTAGLLGFVRFGSVASVVPRKQIEDLQLLLRQKGSFSLHAFVRDGQRVRIRGGSLHGLEGVLLQHEKGRLLISIESVQRSLAIEIQGYELELV
jgi:transcription antitermination factor NusG